MPQALGGFLIAAALAAPSPQPALKTIVTVHSSAFCTTLRTSVLPSIVGLMRNDKLIDLGRSAFMTGDREVKYGGAPTSSFNQQGAATWSPTSGETEMLDYRERELASAIEHNVATVEGILADPKHFPTGSDTQEQAKLAAIKSQLNAILDRQRTAANIVGGAADAADLASLFNADATAFIGGTAPAKADPLNGVSPLQARLASTKDPVASSQAKVAQAEASRPLSSPYEKLADAMESDQVLIGQSESTASHAIVDAASGCK